jgi:hypothetical protein
MANNICSVSSMKAPKAVRRDLVNFWSILLDPWTHDFRPALTSSAAALAAFFRHQDGNVAYQVLIIIYIGNMYIYIYKLYIYIIFIRIYTVYTFGGWSKHLLRGYLKALQIYELCGFLWNPINLRISSQARLHEICTWELHAKLPWVGGHP